MRIKKIGILLVYLLATCSFLPAPAEAYTMSDNNYILNIQEATPAKKQNIPVPADLSPLPTQIPLAAKPVIMQQNTDFLSLSVSSMLIDFGILSPTNPIIRNHTISIKSSGLTSLFVSETQPLLDNQTNTSIPDTTCDTGTCLETQSGAWTNNLTFGFGYRCDNLLGSACNSDFKEQNSFKQFPDLSHFEDLQEIAKTSYTSSDSKIQLTYKVTISGSQKAGNYQTVVSYIAAPGY